MARRRTKRSTSQILFYILSVLMVLSMALGYALLAAPSNQSSKPAPVTPSASRTVVATAVPPTATVPAPTITPIPLPARATTDPAVTQFSFAVIGDSRGGLDVYRSLLKMVESDGNSFLIHLGGMVETGAEAEFQTWREMMAGFTLPVHTAPGSSDLKAGSLANYLAFTGASGAHESFDRGQVHIAVADASRGYLTTEEIAWLSADLAASHKPVKMVALHAPPFDPRGSAQVMTMGNDAFLTLVKQQEVKYVFAGSVRAYDQTVQDGVTYVISGGGGAPLSRADADGGYYHYVRVTVNGSDVKIEARRLK